LRVLEILPGIGNETQYPTLGDYAYETLRKNIIDGTLAPETRLRELEVAAALGVSRVPVRDALGRLADEGLVNKRPHGRGAVVATPTVAEVLEYYEARAGLERLSAKLAATHASADDLAALKSVVADGLAAAEAGDFQTSSRLGSEFHRTIARMSTNGHLLELICGYDLKIGWAHAAVARHGGAVRWTEHVEVLDAIAAGDPAAAATAMEAHTDASTLCFVEAVRAAEER
jgi:DNA-binding GntR family transcriptional regulator